MYQPKGLLKLLKIDGLIDSLTDYVETRVALVRAEAKDELMKAKRAAIIYGSVALIGFFFFLFLNLTIALALNEVLDSSFWGFGIVAGFYLIVLMVLYSLRNSKKVKDMMGDGSLALFAKKQPEEPTKDKKIKEEEEHELIPEKPIFEHGVIEFSKSYNDRPAQRSASSTQPSIKVQKVDPDKENK